MPKNKPTSDLLKIPLKIESWPIARFIEYARNPRKNDSVIDKMVSSIKEFGFRIPIVAKSDGSVVDGHLRLKAAKKLGMTDIPVALADELTDAQIKAFRLLANRSVEWAEWDNDLLKLELDELKEMDFDLILTGFELDEISEIVGLDAGGGGLTDPDDVSDVQENEPPVSKMGDIWILGNHRLMCGDSTDSGGVALLMAGQKADMVFTDPPYGVSIGDKNKFLNGKRKGSKAVCENIANDTLPANELYDILVAAFTLCRENCKDDASYYVTAPVSGEVGMMMMMMMQDSGLKINHVLMWLKNSPTFSMGRLDYDYKHEPIFYTWTKKHKFYGKGKFKNSVWEFPKPQKSELHPTMKPVELVENALLNSSQKDDVVLDIFGGSGTTLIACEQTNRQCRMMELDPHYCDVIIKRWQDFTGQKAVHEASGKNFNDMK